MLYSNKETKEQTEVFGAAVAVVVAIANGLTRLHYRLAFVYGSLHEDVDNQLNSWDLK